MSFIRFGCCMSALIQFISWNEKKIQENENLEHVWGLKDVELKIMIILDQCLSPINLNIFHLSYVSFDHPSLKSLFVMCDVP